MPEPSRAFYRIRQSIEESKFGKSIQLSAVVLSLSAVVMALTTTMFITQKHFEPRQEEKYAILARSLVTIEHRIEQIEKMIIDPEDVKLSYLRAKIDGVESEISALKQLILDDPEGILTLPLIKKDIDGLKNDIESLGNEISRMYGFGKWFLGILVTISIGLLSAVVALIVKK